MSARPVWRLPLAPPYPADDMGWGRASLLRGHGAACVAAFLGYGDDAALPDRMLPHGLRLGPGRVAPDLFRTRAGLIVASRAARAAIEALEPGRHRNWPVTLFDATGGMGGRHGLIVRAQGHALREAPGLVHAEPAAPCLGLPRHVALTGEAAAVDPARLPRAHLWWDRALSVPYLLASDALAERLAALPLPPRMVRCR